MIDPNEYQNKFHQQSLDQMIDQFYSKYRLPNDCRKSLNQRKSSYMNHNRTSFAFKSNQPLKHSQTIVDRTLDYIEELERPTSPQCSKLTFDYDSSFSPKRQFTHHSNNNNHRLINSKINKYDQFIHDCRFNDKKRTILGQERVSPTKVNYSHYFSLKN